MIPRGLISGALVIVLATGWASAQNDPPREPAASRFRERLEALQPADPGGYYRLGEEVKDSAASPQEQRLAVELFVLAFALDHARPEGGDRLAASSCLALADLARVEQDRRWLVALARAMDPRRTPPEWLARPTLPTPDSAAYQVCTAMGYVRSGDGARARQLLARPEVKAGLERRDLLLSRMGVPGGARGILREAERWPCPDCGNERVLRRGRGETAEGRVCPRCGGNPGPALTVEEMVAHLRFESYLLRGEQRSWAAQLAVEGSTPLLDPDPAGVAPTFLVDTRLVYWRNGHWAAGADGSMPAPAKKEAEKKDEAPPPAPPATPNPPAAPAGVPSDQ
jgi:predicted RNA-binding Zn-ribbon protein involved in translation (DUF1610 family)